MKIKSFLTWLQCLVPQHSLSRLIGKLADCQVAWLKNIAIHWFIKRYQVDMSEALVSEPGDYQSFNDFFTRRLKPEARPFSSNANELISPVDGTISQLGNIEQGRLLQAKNQHFSLIDLLGGDAKRAKPFAQGSFMTLYLAPKDYHRVHMPLSGTLIETAYVPGCLFSVNPTSTAHIPGLFARNERLVCLFKTDFGPLAVVLVGAMIVAGIHTLWSGQVTPYQRKLQVISHRPAARRPIKLNKGDELGHFQLGSTVILCLPPDLVNWRNELTTEQSVRFGQPLAILSAN
jgi:phosphatidylserine decarboxylase